MLVQARGMLIAVRLVPTPSSTNLLSTFFVCHTASYSLFFAPLSFDSEYRSGLSYACGIVVLHTHVRARTVGCEGTYEGDFFPMRECG